MSRILLADLLRTVLPKRDPSPLGFTTERLMAQWDALPINWRMVSDCYLASLGFAKEGADGNP